MTLRLPVITLAIALAVGAAVPAVGAELRVGKGGHATLEAAIREARPHDVIRVAAGTYQERLVLDKPLTILGAGMPVIDGGGQGDVITILAPDCRLSGLHVRGSGIEALSDAAAVRVAAPRAVVEGCHIDRSLYGIYMDGARGGRLTDNTIVGMPELDLTVRGDGIRLHDSAHNQVRGNRIQDTRDGIYVNASPFNTIQDNVIRKVRYGLHYMYSDDNVFTGNRFTETEAGSALMFSRRIRLRDNVFAGNRGYRAYGLLIKDCEDSQVESNALVGNRVGLFMDGAIQVRVTGNRVVGNDLGFEIRGSSEANTFRGNTVAGNTESVATPTGIGENAWQGNYWSGYRGYDLDGDGTGDVPHEAGSVFSYLLENMPPARLFLLSPAIQALEFAERSFPIVDAPSIRDASPSMRPREAASGEEATGGGVSVPLMACAALLLLAGLLPLLLSRRAFHA